MTHTKVAVFPTARIPVLCQDPAEVAAVGMHQYIGDFLQAVHAATTPDRALQIRHMLSVLTAEIIGAEMVALDRADQLVKEM